MQLLASQEAASATHELSQVDRQHDVMPSTRHTKSVRSSAEESHPSERAGPTAHGECEHDPMEMVQVLVPP